MLQGCTALKYIHVLFDEWTLCSVQCLGAMKTVHILCFAADSVASLECHTLYELGSHGRVLRLMGRAASLLHVEVFDWKAHFLKVSAAWSALRLSRTQGHWCMLHQCNLNRSRKGERAMAQ